VFQIDQTVASSEVNPAHIDPVKEIARIIGKVVQVLGQMNTKVESVGDVEDDPSAAVLDCGA
jgi:hypothetical protein